MTCFVKQRSTLEQAEPAAPTMYLLMFLWLLSKSGQSCIGTKGFELTHPGKFNITGIQL